LPVQQQTSSKATTRSKENKKRKQSLGIKTKDMIAGPGEAPEIDNPLWFKQVTVNMDGDKKP